MRERSNIFLLLVLVAATSLAQILPVQRVETRYGYTSYTKYFYARPYTLQVQFGINKTANLLIDTGMTCIICT